jgi:hypothetical protein
MKRTTAKKLQLFKQNALESVVCAGPYTNGLAAAASSGDGSGQQGMRRQVRRQLAHRKIQGSPKNNILQ